MSFAGKWMELEIILLNKISQTQKTKHHVCSLPCRILKIRHETRRDLIREQEGFRRRRRG
jgi:hypothetical protein